MLYVSTYHNTCQCSVNGGYYQPYIKYHYIKYHSKLPGDNFIQTVIQQIYQEATICQLHVGCKYRTYVYKRKQLMVIIYCRSDTVLSNLGTLFYLILIRAFQAGIIKVILQMKKLRFREVNSSAMWPVMECGANHP